MFHLIRYFLFSFIAPKIFLKISLSKFSVWFCPFRLAADHIYGYCNSNTLKELTRKLKHTHPRLISSMRKKEMNDYAYTRVSVRRRGALHISSAYVDLPVIESLSWNPLYGDHKDRPGVRSRAHLLRLLVRLVIWLWLLSSSSEKKAGRSSSDHLAELSFAYEYV